MRKIFLFTAFSAFFAVPFVGIPAVHAQNASGMAASHFVAEGRFYYEQGKYKRAIDSFSKALLSDPDNEEAQEFLEKMGVSGSIYLGRDASLNEITRLSRSVAELKAENERTVKEAETLQQAVNDLQGQKEGLETELAQKREEIVNLNTDLFQMKHTLNAHLTDIQEKTSELDQIEAELVADEEGAQMAATGTEPLEQAKEQHEQEIVQLQNELKTVKEKAAKATRDREEQKVRVKGLEDELARKQSQLAMVTDKLILAKRKLKERYAHLSKKDETIEDLKRSLYAMKKDLQQARLKLSAVMKGARQDRSSSSEGEEQAAIIKKQDSFILELKNKLAETKGELSKLKDKFQGAAGADAELQARLEETLQQLDETQLALQERNSEYEILQQRFEDTRERLELVESLMQDKDAQIEDLEKDLNTILEEPEAAR